MRSRHLSPAAVLAVLLTLLVGGVAQAAWLAAGSGTGATRSGALVAPTLTAAKSADAPTTSVALSWSDAGQLPGAGYEVRRGSTVLACTASPCVDTGLAPGTQYSYTVTAKLGTAWRRDSNTASATTDAVATPATKYHLGAPATVTAGQSFTVTVTAQRADGTTDTGYTGSKQVSWGGSATGVSPTAVAPTLPTSASFSNGVAAISVTLVKAGSGQLTTIQPALPGAADIIVLPGQGRLAMTGAKTTGATGTDVAQPSCLFGCALAGLGDSRSLTTNISVSDAYGNILTNLSGVTVSFSQSNATGAVPTNLTLPASGPATSVTTVTVSGGQANNTSLTASNATYGSVTATLRK